MSPPRSRRLLPHTLWGVDLGMLMEILFLSAHLPSPRARQAGQKTSYYLCEHLARRHSVHLLGFATENELRFFLPQNMGVFRSWDIVPVTNWRRFRGIITSPNLPLCIASRSSRDFRKKLLQILRAETFDLALLNFTPMLQYRGDLVDIPAVGGIEHDVTFQNWQRRRDQAENLAQRGLIDFEYKRVFRWEVEALTQLDFVIVLNGKDQKLLEPYVAGLPIICTQPWIDYPRERELYASQQREAGSLVFWGAMDRHENIDAALYACQEILPRIVVHSPGVHYYIAGNNPPSRLDRLCTSGNATVCGYVSEPLSFLSSKMVALLPLRLGAGIKIKVLECMAAGLAVVTTAVGAEGIDAEHGVHFLVGNTAQELADYVQDLLSSPSQRERMGMRAREWFLTHYSFERGLQELDGFLAPAVDRTGRQSHTRDRNVHPGL